MIKFYQNVQNAFSNMKMQEVVEVDGVQTTVNTYGEKANDPNAGTPLQGAVKTNPEDRGGLAQHGQDANASALRQVNLIDNTLFKKVMEYHALRYPFYTAMFSKATQYAFKGHKEAEYPEVGDIKTEARTTAAINASNSASVTSISLPVANNDTYIFRKDYTIIVNGVEGYDEGENTIANTNGEPLVLYVTASGTNGGQPTVMAINGPAVSAGSKQTFIPSIPSGTLLTLAAPALAEEEVEVDPINVIPTTRTAYLQKKGYSVAITDFFNEAVKKADWEKNRIKRQALDCYKKLYTTTALFGAKRRFYKTNKNGVRICYTQAGLINQIRMAYQLPTTGWTKDDLIAIAKMLFTAYTDSTEIEVFCGSDAIESLLKIDWGNNSRQITYLKDKDYNIEIASFHCSFGTLNFTHELALTQHHLEKAAIAIPMEDCLRIYRDNGSTMSVDGKKGETGNVEELTKEYFIQDDCFVCNAMNSMLIGPASVFSAKIGTGIEEFYKSVTTLPSSANAGDKVYLTQYDSTNSADAGLYEYDATNGWFAIERISA